MSTDNQLLEEVFEIIGDIMDVDPEEVTLESSADTIASWDSFRHLKMILALEEEFDVVLDEAEVEKCTCVKDLIAVLDAQIG